MASNDDPKPKRSDKATSSAKPDRQKPPPGAEPDPDNPLSHRPRGAGDPRTGKAKSAT